MGTSVKLRQSNTLPAPEDFPAVGGTEKRAIRVYLENTANGSFLPARRHDKKPPDTFASHANLA